MTNTERTVREALVVIERFGMIDGAHHKQWVLDQVVRALTGDGYEAWLREMNGPGETPWGAGIAP